MRYKEYIYESDQNGMRYKGYIYESDQLLPIFWYWQYLYTLIIFLHRLSHTDVYVCVCINL